MQPVGLANTRISTGYAKNSPRSLFKKTFLAGHLSGGKKNYLHLQHFLIYMIAVEYRTSTC